MAKLKWKQRMKGRDTDGREDLHVTTLKPDPILKTITLDVAEEGLRLLGVSLDDLIAGREVHPQPPIDPGKGEKFLRVVLVNAGEYNIRAMPIDTAGAILSVIGAEFFFHASNLVMQPPTIRIESWLHGDSGRRGLKDQMMEGITRRIRAL